MYKKISIQGNIDSFYGAAAQKFFGKKIMLLSCNKVCVMFNLTETNPDIEGAVMLIENSITGSILENYKLLQKSNLKVTGEVYLETEKDNYVRFFILQREDVGGIEVNKASLSFEVDHHIGNLARVLSIIAGFKINLSKLQSEALPHRIWAYAFHADMEFDSVFDFNNAVERMKTFAENIHIYGVYKRGQKPVF